jgi:excisionase family DNA binding protein
MGEKLLTVRQAAEMLQLSPLTIRAWIRRGKIRAVYLGSDAAGYRVPASEIERIIHGRDGGETQSQKEGSCT